MLTEPVVASFSVSSFPALSGISLNRFLLIFLSDLGRFRLGNLIRAYRVGRVSRLGTGKPFMLNEFVNLADRLARSLRISTTSTMGRSVRCLSLSGECRFVVSRVISERLY